MAGKPNCGKGELPTYYHWQIGMKEIDRLIQKLGADKEILADQD